jgi:hypothetical protein
MAQETKQPEQQEIQPSGTAQAPKTAQPVQPKAQPAQTVAQPPIKKKSKWWIWLIVGIVVLAIAAVLYFFVF